MDADMAVLVVEDDPDTREMMATWLRCAGYKVLEAANGDEALRVMAREVPCAMIVDLDMPVMDGAELRKRQLASPELAAIPFILVSASGDSQRAGCAMKADAVIPKPFDAARLLTEIATLCPGSHPHHYSPPPRALGVHRL